MARSAGGATTSTRALQLAMMSQRDEFTRLKKQVDSLATVEAVTTIVRTEIEGAEITTTIVEIDPLLLQQGVSHPDVAESGYRFTTFGVDGSWESVRHKNGNILQTTGGGQPGNVPTNLTALRSLSYTDIDPVPA